MSFSERINSKRNSNVSDLKNSCSLLFLLNRCIVSPLTFTSISNPYPSDTSNERKIENLYRPATEALKMLPSLRRESKVSSMITFENCNGSPCLITDLKKSMKINGLWPRFSMKYFPCGTCIKTETYNWSADWANAAFNEWSNEYHYCMWFGRTKLCLIHILNVNEADFISDG